MTDREKLEIVCGVDANYAPHLAVMLNSLIRSNPDRAVRVHVLHAGIEDALMARVESANPGVEHVWIHVVGREILGFKATKQHISAATYLRLAIADLLDPGLDRVLYLDVDIIVENDLTELWNADLGGNVCGAVVDPGVDSAAFFAEHGLAAGPYFNAGVILFDLDQLREGPFLAQAIELLADENITLELADQDALNLVLHGKWTPLDPRWNFQRHFLFDNYRTWNDLRPKRVKPAIIHFTAKQKPWYRTEYHPCGWLYLMALFRTPFKEEVCRKNGIGVLALLKSWARWMVQRPPMFRYPAASA